MLRGCKVHQAFTWSSCKSLIKLCPGKKYSFLEFVSVNAKVQARINLAKNLFVFN